MFHKKKYDILVIGGGGAGITAAILAARAGASVALVTKEPAGRGDTCIVESVMADGMANPSDSKESLIRDLVLAGAYLNDPVLVELLATHSGEATKIIEEFGMVFSRDRKGKIIPLPFPLGGHSKKRTLKGIAEGSQFGNALRGALYKSGVEVYDEFFITDLLKEQDQVSGALGFDIHSGEFTAWSAKSVILATGGCGRLFAPETTNMKSVTGDGFTLAFRAGAELRDMEHAQYLFGAVHPEGMRGVVLGEPAVALYFGRLIDKDGVDIIDRPGSKTRGQVAIAIAKTIRAKKAGPRDGVFFDNYGNVKRLGDLFSKIIKMAGSSIFDTARFAYGEKASRFEEPWEIVPSFHYFPGGIKVDGNCQTTLKNLYAVGQVQGGLFGADRLGSVSLTELFVFGKIAAEHAAKNVKNLQQPGFDEKIIEQKIRTANRPKGKQGSIRAITLQRRLQEVMRRNVGLHRNENSLKEAIKELERIEDEKNNISVAPYENFNTDWIDYLELDMMIPLGKIIAYAALERRESRKLHFRSDYPEQDDSNWLKTIVIKKGKDKIEVRLDPLGDAWSHIKPYGYIERLPGKINGFIIQYFPKALVKYILNKKFEDFIKE